MKTLKLAARPSHCRPNFCTNPMDLVAPMLTRATMGTFTFHGWLIELMHDNAAGIGKLSFGNGDGSALFGSANPVITGLESDHNDARASLAEGTILTINQSTNTVYRDDIRNENSEPTIGGRIVKAGTGVLRLEGGGSSFLGLNNSEDIRVSVDIQQGTLVVCTFAAVRRRN